MTPLAENDLTTGIFRAKLARRRGCFNWFFLIFFLALSLFALSEATLEWTGFGQSGRSAGAMVGLIGSIFVIVLARNLLRAPGLYGEGIRLLRTGEAESVKLRPGSAGGKDPIGSVVLENSGAGPFTVEDALVNIGRSPQGYWTIDNVLLRPSDGNPGILLTFYHPEENQARLHVSLDGKMQWLGDQKLSAQLRRVSEVLRRTRAHLKLTFTESSSTAASGNAKAGLAIGGPILGAIGAVAAIADSVTRQGKANMALAAGVLPVEEGLQAPLTAIVNEFKYELFVNGNPSEFAQ